MPAYDCELRVTGLRVNERYVFAVAAYTADGQLIGDAIGGYQSPHAILSPPPGPHDMGLPWTGEET